MTTQTQTQGFWKLRGECRNYDPDIFFTPEGTQENSIFNKKRIRRAKAICSTCPVSGNCLDEALAGNEAGVWGGTSWDDRRKIKRRGFRVICIRCGSRDRADTETGQICVRCGLSWLV